MYNLHFLKVNLVIPNSPFLYSLKIWENCKVFWCFQGVEKRYIGNVWVNESRYKQSLVTLHFSNGENLLKKILGKDKCWHIQMKKAL